jgi:hypothetical protein
VQFHMNLMSAQHSYISHISNSNMADLGTCEMRTLVPHEPNYCNVQKLRLVILWSSGDAVIPYSAQ